MENVRKHRDIKLVATAARRKCLVSQPNYHTTIIFFEYLLAIEMKTKKNKKKNTNLNKPVYLCISILEISKIVMYKFWNDYVKTEYGEKAKLYYIDTDSFIIYIKLEDIYVDTAKDVEIRFDTSS